MRKQIAILFRKLLTLISPELNTRFIYYRSFGKRLDLKHPQTDNEKILWLKLYKYNNDPLVAQCADKYAVRDYIKKCGCEEILNELIGVYNDADEIPWKNLPNKFVLKSNYGSGMNILCFDKSAFDIASATQEIKKWKHSTFHLIKSELQYANIKHLILCERFLASAEGKAPNDYKVYCFDGTPKYVMVCTERHKYDAKFYYYDIDGNFQQKMTDGNNVPGITSQNKPTEWGKMIEYARILTKPFPFVRCDFYIVNSKIYFGELTFTPCAGLDTEEPLYTSQLFGSLINLPTR